VVHTPNRDRCPCSIGARPTVESGWLVGSRSEDTWLLTPRLASSADGAAEATGPAAALKVKAAKVRITAVICILGLKE
jgi:hypothetical protein